MARKEALPGNERGIMTMYFQEALAEPMEICEGMMPTGDEG